MAYAEALECRFHGDFAAVGLAGDTESELFLLLGAVGTVLTLRVRMWLVCCWLVPRLDVKKWPCVLLWGPGLER